MPSLTGPSLLDPLLKLLHIGATIPLAASVVLLSQQAAWSLDFTTGNKSSNPYFFNVTGGGASSWTLYKNTTAITNDWGDNCNPEGGPFPCVDFVSASSVDFFSADLTEEAYWASDLSGIPQGYRVSFSAEFIKEDSLADASAGYAIIDGSANIFTAEYTLFGPGLNVEFIPQIASNQRLVFKIYSESTVGTLSITNFSYTEAPGPLPAAGAATAFGYSRRLRRRIQGKRPGGPCPPLQPAHPAAYLNLTTASLKSVPISFSYASQTIVTDRSNMAA